MLTPVTLILGLGRDVGTACARHFQQKGHKVAIAAPDEAALERASDELMGNIVAHHGDLHDLIGVSNAMTAAFEAHNRIDNLVIIPALPSAVSLREIELDQFDNATVHGARAAALSLRLFAETIKDQEPLVSDGPDRQRQHGTVTFVLSLSARLARPGKFTESVSQGAIEAVVRSGAIELAPDFIRVNAVSAIRPRAEDTEPWVRSRTPLGRAALADEIAEAVGYLASPGAAIITGETLILDGGRLQLAGTLDS